MSDSSRHALYAIPEVTYGVTPAVTPAFARVRNTSVSAALSKETLVSEEARPDRQIADVRHGARQTGGDIGYEVSFGSHDLYMEAVLCGTWADQFAAFVSAADITVAGTATARTFTLAAGTWLALIPGLQVGDRFAITGQGVVDVTAVAGAVVTGASAIVNAVLEDAEVTPMVQVLKAGVTRRSFSLLRHFSDIDAAKKPFHLFSGQELSSWEFTAAANALATGSFALVGKDAATPAQTAPDGATLGQPNSNAVMDTFSGSISVTGLDECVVTELTHTLENGIEPRFTICGPTTIKPSIGQSNLTGQLTAYFEDSVLLEQFYSEAEAVVKYMLADKAGNRYRVTYPKVKYTGGQPDTSNTGPITQACPFQAIYDPVSGTNIIVERIPVTAP